MITTIENNIKQTEMNIDATVYEETASYQVGKTTFMVNRIFNDNATDTVGTILIRLITSETDLPAKCSNI